MNPREQRLQARLLQLSFFNLFLVSLLGLWLRSVAVTGSLPFAYKNLLHGHSHFAFGGWITPALTWLIMKYFSTITQKIGYHHWRNIVVLLLSSAYGMLLSFPVQGYGPVSIVFSTISVLTGFYLGYLLWKASAEERKRTSTRFLRAGIIYMVLSSIGPFATGPLIAMGKAGTALYFNSIYFYLHFQYNGWFSFVVMGVLYRLVEGGKRGQIGQMGQIGQKSQISQISQKVQRGQREVGGWAFGLFNLSCVPAFFLSILWSHPAGIFYWVGGLAGLLQLAALAFLLQDMGKLKILSGFIRSLFIMAISALALKLLLQFAGAFPAVSELAYKGRNFIIAYLHLVLLGFISLSIFVLILLKQQSLPEKKIKPAILIFLVAFITTELLILNGALPYSFQLPHLALYLFAFSCLFPLSALLLFFGREKS